MYVEVHPHHLVGGRGFGVFAGPGACALQFLKVVGVEEAVVLFVIATLFMDDARTVDIRACARQGIVELHGAGRFGAEAGVQCVEGGKLPAGVFGEGQAVGSHRFAAGNEAVDSPGEPRQAEHQPREAEGDERDDGIEAQHIVQVEPEAGGPERAMECEMALYGPACPFPRPRHDEACQEGDEKGQYGVGHQRAADVAREPEPPVALQDEVEEVEVARLSPHDFQDVTGVGVDKYGRRPACREVVHLCGFGAASERDGRREAVACGTVGHGAQG